MTHFIQGQKDSEEHLKDLSLAVTEIKKKVWGVEEILQNNEYCLKIMRISPDHQVSMHWHSEKTETFVLISGRLIIETLTQEGDTRVIELTNQLQSFTLCKNVPHSFYCPKGQIGETVFIEASTKDKENDSYRIFPSK